MENAFISLPDALPRTLIGSYLPAHPSFRGGHVTLALPSGPEENVGGGGVKNDQDMIERM